MATSAAMENRAGDNRTEPKYGSALPDGRVENPAAETGEVNSLHKKEVIAGEVGKEELQSGLEQSSEGMDSGLYEEGPSSSSVDAATPMARLPRIVCESLYVADLHPFAVTNTEALYNLFSQCGNLAFARIVGPTVPTPGQSVSALWSAHVRFHSIQAACHAWQTLNYQLWMGLPMRIMFWNNEPSTRFNYEANIIIKDLEESIDSMCLRRMFCGFGVVLSIKVEERGGISTGQAYVQFEDADDAKRAIDAMNNATINGRRVYVGPFLPRGERPVPSVQVQQEAEQEEIPVDQKLPAKSPGVAISAEDGHREESVRQTSKSAYRDALVGSSSTSATTTSTDLRSGPSDPASGPHNSREGTSNLTERVSRCIHGKQKKESGSGTKRHNRWTSSARNKARNRYLQSKKVKVTPVQSTMADSQHDLSPQKDLSSVLSSEPWPMQPWSVTTLKTMLSKSHCHEERLAMLGGTLLPLVSKQTKSFASDVTNEIVKLEIGEIKKLMLSEDEMAKKVEELKKVVLERFSYVAASLGNYHPAAALEKWGHVDHVEDVKRVILEASAPSALASSPPTLDYPVQVVEEFLPPPTPAPAGVAFAVLPFYLPIALPSTPASYKTRAGTGYFEPLVINRELEEHEDTESSASHVSEEQVQQHNQFEVSASSVSEEQLQPHGPESGFYALGESADHQVQHELFQKQLEQCVQLFKDAFDEVNREGKAIATEEPQVLETVEAFEARRKGKAIATDSDCNSLTSHHRGLNAIPEERAQSSSVE